MEPSVARPEPGDEYFFQEGCFILETWNRDIDPAVSIARARVEPGTTTEPHYLDAVTERYLIISGRGEVYLGGLDAEPVCPGDIVVVPAGMSQSIRNTGDADLVFYAICTPRFTRACYRRSDASEE